MTIGSSGDHDGSPDVAQEIRDRRERQQKRIGGFLARLHSSCAIVGFHSRVHQIVAILGEALFRFVRRIPCATRPKSVTRLRGGEATDGKQLLRLGNGRGYRAYVMLRWEENGKGHGLSHRFRDHLATTVCFSNLLSPWKHDEGNSECIA